MLEQLGAFLAGTELRWWDVVDILLVAFIVYQLLQFIRGTHAVQIALGGFVLALLYWASILFNLQTVNWLLRTFLPFLVFGIIVVFQAEIRKGLAHLGRAPFLGGAARRRQEERPARGKLRQWSVVGPVRLPAVHSALRIGNRHVDVEGKRQAAAHHPKRVSRHVRVVRVVEPLPGLRLEGDVGELGRVGLQVAVGVTPEALGRFVLKYGTLNAAKMLSLAQLPDGVAEVSLLDGPADAMPVLLVTTEA